VLKNLNECLQQNSSRQMKYRYVEKKEREKGKNGYKKNLRENRKGFLVGNEGFEPPTPSV
jgi:hypothetical protein